MVAQLQPKFTCILRVVKWPQGRQIGFHAGSRDSHHAFSPHLQIFQIAPFQPANITFHHKNSHLLCSQSNPPACKHSSASNRIHRFQCGKEKRHRVRPWHAGTLEIPRQASKLDCGVLCLIHADISNVQVLIPLIPDSLRFKLHWP